MKIKVSLLFLIFTMLTIVVYAEEIKSPTSPDLTQLGIEELMEIEVATVYGASKYEQKVTEAPSSVTVITAEEIRKYGYRTLADILRSVRGFYVTYDRNYNYLGSRGFSRPGDYNTRFLLLVDGHRINDNVYDGAYFGTEFIIDVDLIERVEIIRGPGSSLYGTNAFFGVINIITKQGRDFKGTEISGEAGSFDTYKGRLSYGNKFQNGLEILLSGSLYDSKGQRHLFFKEFDDPATNNGVAENADDDQYNSFFTKLSFHDFTLQAAYVSREKVIPTGSWDTVFNNPRTRTTDELSYIDLNYNYDFGRQTNIQARVYYDQYYYKGDYLYDYPPVTLNKDRAWGDWWGGELKLTTKVVEKHLLTLGAEYRDNFRQDQSNYDEDPFCLYLEDTRDSTILAFYLQDEFKILKNLILNAGLRHDHYSTFGGTTNPRLALIFTPFEKTIFKLLYGEAFRAPNAYELYYDDGGISTKSNPDLNPETIKTYELSLEQYLGNNLHISASGFYYKINDLISQQIDPVDNLIMFNNVEDVEAKGFELELDGRWDSGLRGRISYTYQETENRQTGEILTSSPKHLAKLNIIVPVLKEKVFLGIETQYVSKVKTLEGNYASDYFLANLTLFSQNLLKSLETSATVYNLFDEKYGNTGSEEHAQDIIEQDGRSFRIKLTYKF
ncbi:MAG: hypothetical protein A2Y81_02375 [Nitrospirae bacterium RBG_13_43_8]|nr:MAG: hypothetical protein A2Y81_02375 [Nitrospirae bacterium RBG_13_43_8]